MRRKRIAVLGVLLAPLVVGASAHSISASRPVSAHTVARDSTACLDTLHASDSTTYVVKFSVRPQDTTTRLPPDFEGLFAQEFRARLKTPSNLRLSVMRGLAPCDTIQKRCAGGVMVFGLNAYAIAHSDGTLSEIGVVDLSLTPVFSDSVRAVLLKMSGEHLIPYFSRRGSIPLEIRIEMEDRPDTVARERQLFRVTVPRFRSEFKHAVMRKIKPPKYPLNAAMARVGHKLVLTFTILPNGAGLFVMFGEKLKRPLPRFRGAHFDLPAKRDLRASEHWWVSRCDLGQANVRVCYALIMPSFPGRG